MIVALDSDRAPFFSSKIDLGGWRKITSFRKGV